MTDVSRIIQFNIEQESNRASDGHRCSGHAARALFVKVHFYLVLSSLPVIQVKFQHHSALFMKLTFCHVLQQMEKFFPWFNVQTSRFWSTKEIPQK